MITTSELDLRAAFGRFFFAKRLPGLARLRHAVERGGGLLMEEDRKSPLPGQSDVNDPGRVKTFFILQELHAAGVIQVGATI